MDHEKLLAIFSRGERAEGEKVTLTPELVDEALALAAAAPEPSPEEAATAAFAASPQAKAMRAEIDRLTRANEEADLRRIDEDAARFAADEVRAARAMPAEVADLKALFRQAALDDRSAPAKVAFSSAAGAATTGTRVELLRTAAARRTPHDLYGHALTGADLPEGAAVVAFHVGDGAEARPSKERTEQLLAMTPAGKAAARITNGRN